MIYHVNGTFGPTGETHGLRIKANNETEAIYLAEKRGYYYPKVMDSEFEPLFGSGQKKKIIIKRKSKSKKMPYKRRKTSKRKVAKTIFKKLPKWAKSAVSRASKRRKTTKRRRY